jgi:hypothetical protein
MVEAGKPAWLLCLCRFADTCGPQDEPITGLYRHHAGPAGGSAPTTDHGDPPAWRGGVGRRSATHKDRMRGCRMTRFSQTSSAANQASPRTQARSRSLRSRSAEGSCAARRQRSSQMRHSAPLVSQGGSAGEVVGDRPGARRPRAPHGRGAGVRGAGWGRHLAEVAADVDAHDDALLEIARTPQGEKLESELGEGHDPENWNR